MPAFVNPPPHWLWHHSPERLKIYFFVAGGSCALTALLSILQYCHVLHKGSEVKNSKGLDVIQVPRYAQQILEIIQKPLLLSVFALLSIVAMPFGHVFDIILAVTLSVVVQDFAALCVDRFKNTDKLFCLAAGKPEKWTSRPPCCWCAVCVKPEPLQLKHMQRANVAVWWYVSFIPFNAMVSMILDMAYPPPITLDAHGWCSAASANKNPPWDYHGYLTLVTTMFGMWGIGSLAAAVDLCYGPAAKATSQLNFIRMYQIVGLAKPLILHFLKPPSFKEPTWPMATIPNLDDALANGTTATSSVVDCPVYDNDCMSRLAFLTFTCVWMLFVAFGNRTRFTLEHEETMRTLEQEMESKSEGLLKPKPIHMTLG